MKTGGITVTAIVILTTLGLMIVLLTVRVKLIMSYIHAACLDLSCCSDHPYIVYGYSMRDVQSPRQHL